MLAAGLGGTERPFPAIPALILGRAAERRQSEPFSGAGFDTQQRAAFTLQQHLLQQWEFPCTEPGNHSKSEGFQAAKCLNTTAGSVSTGIILTALKGLRCSPSLAGPEPGQADLLFLSSVLVSFSSFWLRCHSLDSSH